jgi:hypothetical protein
MPSSLLTITRCAVVLIMFALTTPHTTAQKLRVTPLDGLVDEPLRISVSKVQPGQAITIRASTIDNENKLWQSYAGFYADSAGNVGAEQQAPSNASYSGIDAMGLIWSMNVAGELYDKARFNVTRLDSLVFRFSLEIESRIVDSSTVIRRFMTPDVQWSRVNDASLVGTIFRPLAKGPSCAILVIGGSEGGISGEDVAAVLASHGYSTFALAYFGIGDLPSSLDEIPMEYFQKAITKLLGLPNVDSNGIVILGTSKGAEASLLLGSLDRRVRGIVGYVPSGVVWSCVCNAPNRSSWSVGGRPVPFIAGDFDPTFVPPKGFPISPAINYQYRLQKTKNLDQVQIPVERINGPILLISGKDDRMWPSFTLSELVMHRLKDYQHPFTDEHLTFDRAGHLIGKLYLPAGSTSVAGGRLTTGGTPEGNAKAQAKSWPVVLRFLETVFHTR